MASEGNKKENGIVCYVGHGFWESSLDPLKGGCAFGFDFISNGLIRVNASAQYEGDLAESWEISNDAMTYVFKLKKNVRFHNGEAFTAKDVAFTYRSVMERQGQNEKVDLSKVENVQVLDDYTVEFTLKEPFSPFLDTTALLGIVPEKSYDSESFDQTPVGTGPWKALQYDAKQQLIVEANEDYFEGTPQIRRVTFVDMENEAAFSNAKSGQLDVVMVQPVYANEVIPGMHLEKLETMDVRNISLPCKKPGTMIGHDGQETAFGNAVTSDLSVRKALSVGIDRQQIIDHAFLGVGKPAEGWTNHLAWGNTKEYPDAQTKEAQRILEQAGWKDQDGDGIREKDGIKCAFEVYAPSDEQDRYLLAAAVAENVRSLGIAMEVRQASWDEIAKLAYSQAVVWGYGQYSPMVIDNLFRSDHFAKRVYSNANGYENKRVDEKIDQAIGANSQQDALAMWKEAQTLYAQEYPYLFLANMEHCYFVSDSLDVSLSTQIPHPHGHGIPIICNMKDWKLKES